MKIPTFVLKCELAARSNDVDVVFFRTDKSSDPCGDDGNLHISKGALRACFGIGQDEKVSVFNKKVENILTELGLGKFIGPRVLVRDDCPHGCDEQGCNGECGCQECGESKSCCTCEDEEKSEE